MPTILRATAVHAVCMYVLRGGVMFQQVLLGRPGAALQGVETSRRRPRHRSTRRTLCAAATDLAPFGFGPSKKHSKWCLGSSYWHVVRALRCFDILAGGDLPGATGGAETGERERNEVHTARYR